MVLLFLSQIISFSHILDTNFDFLDENEFEIMKTYPYYTKKILANLMGFNDISNWASRAQERVDGQGYPYKFSGKDLSLKDRLMAVLNVYQSLTIKKSYRNKYNHRTSRKGYIR